MKKKGTDQLRGTAKLVCAFVFAYANCWFSDVLTYKGAQITNMSKSLLKLEDEFIVGFIMGHLDHTVSVSVASLLPVI